MQINQELKILNVEEKHYKNILRSHVSIARDIESGKYTLENNSEAIAKYEITGEILALINSGYKCECCETNIKLTLHHLVLRKNKVIIPQRKYLTQRRFFKNIIVLCVNCHNKIDHCGTNGNIIEHKKIENINQKYQKYIEIHNEEIQVTL